VEEERMNATITRSSLNISVEVKSRFFKLDGRKLKISRVLKDKQNELKYRTLVEHIPDAIFSVDLQGNIVGINKAAEILTGFRKEELFQMSFLAYFQFEGYGAPMRFNELLNKKVEIEKTAIRHKAGHNIWVNITCIPIVSGNKTIGFYAIIKDITKYTNAMEEMKKLQKMIDNSMDMIILATITKSGEIKIVNANHYLCKKLGYNKNELASKSYFELYAKKRGQLERLLQKLQLEKRVKTRMYLLRKNGEKLRGEVYLCLFELNGEKFIQTVARDILEFENDHGERLDRGTRLRVIMSKKNINTSELAEMTGLSIATISNLRTGKINKPHIGTAKLVADYLEVDLSDIWDDM
jgi:PAS domain S-box-containing protein